MKQYLLLAFIIFSISQTSAQEKALKITNLASQKEVLIKQNKRVKITTLDGTKIKGRIQIKNNSIFIKDQEIQIDDIASIRKNPLLTSLLTSGLLIYAGGITAGIGVIIAAFGSTSALWLLVPAAGLIALGIKSPNVNKNYKINSNWSYEIIQLNNVQASKNKAELKVMLP